VNGPQPVANSQMTASSEYVNGEGYFGPSQARLNNALVDFANNTYNAGIWASVLPPDTNQYLQVCLNFTETAAFVLLVVSSYFICIRYAYITIVGR